MQQPVLSIVVVHVHQIMTSEYTFSYKVKGYDEAFKKAFFLKRVRRVNFLGSMSLTIGFLVE